MFIIVESKCLNAIHMIQNLRTKTKTEMIKGKLPRLFGRIFKDSSSWDDQFADYAGERSDERKTHELDRTF